MSVLIYTESQNGNFKKSSFEVVAYGKKVAEQLGCKAVAIAIDSSEPHLLSNYGADKVLQINDVPFNAKAYTAMVKQIIDKENATVVIFESTPNALYIAPMLTAKVNGSYANNVVALPSDVSPFTVKRKVFSNKAFANEQLLEDIKIIALAKNSYDFSENPVAENVEVFQPEILADNVKQQSIEKFSGKVSIADADIIVSGGRGLKAPENWGMIEELAGVLGAATACSKPVSDLGWRPHSEHVGQTGKPASSDLYIAIGISGAIQHLAGVNSSKVKVVINSDPNAPFFKSADYGIVGDAFEIVPQLIEKLR